jgi:hypothetical protein
MQQQQGLGMGNGEAMTEFHHQHGCGGLITSFTLGSFNAESNRPMWRGGGQTQVGQGEGRVQGEVEEADFIDRGTESRSSTTSSMLHSHV